MKTAEILILVIPLLIIAMLLSIIGTSTTSSIHAGEYKAPSTLKSDNKTNKADYYFI